LTCGKRTVVAGNGPDEGRAAQQDDGEVFPSGREHGLHNLLREGNDIALAEDTDHPPTYYGHAMLATER
jgi:hypothetical protein